MRTGDAQLLQQLPARIGVPRSTGKEVVLCVDEVGFLLQGEQGK